MAVSERRKSGRGRSPERREGPAFVDDLMAMAGSLANSRKQYASAQLETLADSVRQFAEGLHDIPTVRTYAESAADSLDGLASYVLDSELPEIIADARNLARRHPLVTFGGSVVAGILVTQLVQARAETMRSALQVSRQRSPASPKRADATSGNAA